MAKKYCLKVRSWTIKSGLNIFLAYFPAPNTAVSRIWKKSAQLAIVLCMAACQQGKRVRFWRVTELITQLMEAREERLLARMKTQLAKLDLMILDELGYVPASKLGSELLFDVISTAYERTSVIVTTNLPFEQWTEVLGSERLTGAVLDRLTHRCHILESNGESYRLKDARRRVGSKKAAAKTPAGNESDSLAKPAANAAENPEISLKQGESSEEN